MFPNRAHRKAAWVVLLLACLPAVTTPAQMLLTETVKLTAPDGVAFDRFGRSVALDASAVIVGAPFDDDLGDGSGSVYRFAANDGSFIEKLRLNQGEDEDGYGESVALRGGALLVGAPRSDRVRRDAGAASLIGSTGGQSVLLPFSPSPFAPDFSMFGERVNLSSDGTTVVVGARGDTGHGDEGANGGGGAIYVSRDGAPLQKLFADDAGFADNFGYSVATSRDVVVGAAPFDDDNGETSGSIYAYDTLSGNQLFKFVPADTVAFDFFGGSLAITGSTIAVGAPFQSQAAGDSGAVYLVDAVTGLQRDKLTLPGATRVGFAVAMDGPLLAVGGNEAAFVFDHRSGQLLAELKPSDPAADLFFGASIAIDGSTIVVGAEGDETNGERSGAAYVFTLGQLQDDDADGIFDAVDNCLIVTNMMQRDTDGDGFGNMCDADFNQDCIVNFQDLGILRTTFFSNDALTDLDGNGVVNFIDLAFLRFAFFSTPGPSGLVSSCP